MGERRGRWRRGERVRPGRRFCVDEGAGVRVGCGSPGSRGCRAPACAPGGRGRPAAAAGPFCRFGLVCGSPRERPPEPFTRSAAAAAARPCARLVLPPPPPRPPARSVSPRRLRSPAGTHAREFRELCWRSVEPAAAAACGPCRRRGPHAARSSGRCLYRSHNLHMRSHTFEKVSPILIDGGGLAAERERCGACGGWVSATGWLGGHCSEPIGEHNGRHRARGQSGNATSSTVTVPGATLTATDLVCEGVGLAEISRSRTGKRNNSPPPTG